jgi:hypothetical protein
VSGEPGAKSGEPGAASGEPDPKPSHSEAERRRKRAEIFGDVLPETSADERGETGGTSRTGRTERNGPARSDPGEEWLREQVPPHHT